MTTWVNKHILFSLVFVAANQATHAGSGTRLEQLNGKSIDVSKLDMHTVPAPYAPKAKRGQIFSLRASGMPDLTIIPVTYLKAKGDPDLNPISLRCGVYLSPQVGEANFVKVIPTKVYSRWCTGIEAMGTMPDLGPRPRLIIIFDSSVNMPDDNPVPFILSWDKQKNVYQLDQMQTTWLLNQNVPGGTVASVRHTLAHYDPNQTYDDNE